MKESILVKALHQYFPFGFQLSRKSWDWLGQTKLLEVADAAETQRAMYAIRQLSDLFNEKRRHSSHAIEPVQAGQLFSVSVIVDILRYVSLYYCHEQIPGVMPRGTDWTGKKRGSAVVEQPPPSFVGLFPPVEVLREKQTNTQYLQSRSEIAPNPETVAAEIILLSLAMENPAFAPYKTLFDDLDLKRESPYVPLVGGLEEFFATQPAFGPLGMPLFQCLRAPMQAAPDSLDGQLDYIKVHWARFLPAELLERLLLARDILREETQLRGLGPGPTEVLQFLRRSYGYDLSYAEPACFSQDANWMSNVVIIAKTVYVWLDQLSKKYQRAIQHLDEIPDEELDRLARWGFTGLWLIGLWERSQASQRIKQIMGNPEAASSAYSLYDYVIAADLGGEEAYQRLRERAWQRGIRLASDMVPNHMGIYSKWVVEHPDWFIQSDYPPYPCYNFTGVDLSWDSRVVIQIEDGYWEHRDAAVVFKRIDKWTGNTKYIYHGNDGTSMPWNDTAQLNFMLPEVREAVIQTILHVARKFPIIRFDAAMTLAKRHYQRLWFPQHGDGGAIPSRAEHGMSKPEFDVAFPKEFWREVVDRVAQEVPDTLLLAEAFWLMEGYFVRTLGMHRVYNSAFMNMLKMEDNGKYRTTVNNVLKFSPEVLNRFVNFMNNPDERTAIEQFGKGDKYFGVAMLMVTMPGLPMFGHGQIEGFTEKYGMEYRRAYWDEQVDEEMVRRHEREIFPLMRRRRLFSGATNFAFYDFVTADGWVDDNVFAYSNRVDGERAVIIYNNAYNTTTGKIHSSTPVKIGPDDQEAMISRPLAEALALNTGQGYLYAFRDHHSGLEYLRSGRQIADEGMFAVLYAYQYQAFLDFREIYDSDGSWSELLHRLSGSGVPSIDEAYREMKMEPVLSPFRSLLNADTLMALAASKPGTQSQVEGATSRLLNAVKNHLGATKDTDIVLQAILTELTALGPAEPTKAIGLFDALPYKLRVAIDDDNRVTLHHVAAAWIMVHHLGEFHAAEESIDSRTLSRQRLDEWLLRKATAGAFQSLRGDGATAHADALLVAVLVAHDQMLLPSAKLTVADHMTELLRDALACEYLQVNRHEDVLWLNKERLERMLAATLLVNAVQLQAKGDATKSIVDHVVKTAQQLRDLAAQASYQVAEMMQLLARLYPGKSEASGGA
jgi:glycosidase